MASRRDNADAGREDGEADAAAVRRAVFAGADWPAQNDPLVLVLVYLLAVSALFVLLPGLDLWVSGLFYRGDTFPATAVERLVRLRFLGDRLVILVVVVLAASLVAKVIWPLRPIAIRPRATAFLLASLALGPGLVVNGLFKSLSGRPRPVAVDVFGGPSPFVPAWRFSDHCASNCSFISGEASSALWLLGVVMLAPRGLRLWLGVPAALLVLALSLNRIAFGGHFASDVLISFGFTALVMLIAYRLIVTGPFGAPIDAAVERGLADAGLRLRRRLAGWRDSA